MSPKPPVAKKIPKKVPKKLFVSLTEVRPRKGCQLDPADCAGAFVRCYVTETTSVRAQQRMRRALRD